MGFSRQGYWSGLLLPSTGDLSWPRDQTPVSCTEDRFFTNWATRKACYCLGRSKRSLCSPLRRHSEGVGNMDYLSQLGGKKPGIEMNYSWKVCGEASCLIEWIHLTYMGDSQGYNRFFFLSTETVLAWTKRNKERMKWIKGSCWCLKIL